MFSIAQVAHLSIMLYKWNELDDMIKQAANTLKSEDRIEASEADIAAVEAIQTADELIKAMRKLKGPNCHNALTDKALSMEDEALPKIVERYYRNSHEVFLEAARSIIFYADEKYLKELFTNYKEIRSPYAQSLICLLIGMAKYDDVDGFLMKEFYRFKRQYPDKLYCDYPHFALGLLHPELICE